MKTLTLLVKDAQVLNEIKIKLINQHRLSSIQHNILSSFLSHLPPTETLLSEKFLLSDEAFEIKVFDIEEIWPHLHKWIDLFNKLPKNWSRYPKAGWIDADKDGDVWARNAIIEIVFIPSLEYSKKNKKDNKIISLYLKTDGTAIFELYTIKDTENFPELYNFKGSWKEAYFLVVKTLQQGWPQTQFPVELKQFLKK